MNTATSLQPAFWMKSPELAQHTPGGGAAPSEVEVFKAMDQFLDLGARSQSRTGAVQGLDQAGQVLFMRHLQDLVRLGIVGTETLEVDGQRREVFVDTAYADPRLRDAPPYRKSSLSHIDLRA